MKLWGGRFQGVPDELMERFNSSSAFDRRLWAADVQGSMAYAKALSRAGILNADELEQTLSGLREITLEFEAGAFEFQSTDEDIHTAVERRLTELRGSVAGKLHTGRSRNDQVATDLRLYLLSEIAALRRLLLELQKTLVRRAEQHLDVLMPGYTHLQRAQPVLFSHWLMSFFWMLQRDQDRLHDLEKRVSVLPLGSGALAGSTLSIDRAYLQEQLGFQALSENSLDAVSDRDFVAEFLFWAALLQTHLSRLAEDLIVWSSAEFGFVGLADAYSTGSSLMPQKKNPDSLELLRGKTGRVLGALMTILTVLKGLPSTYNKDLQEDKEPLFDVLDTLRLALPVAEGAVRTLEVDAEAMFSALEDSILATDVAEYLVQRGVPFRESHDVVSRIVRRADEASVSLSRLPLADFVAESDAFGEDIFTLFDHRRSVEAKDSPGGTATAAVRRQIRRALRLLSDRGFE